MSEPLEVIVEATPNPNAVKLSLNRVIATQGKTYRDAASAEALWAKQLLAIPGVVQVFAVNNFISVTKEPSTPWEAIIPQAEEALQRTLA